MRPDSFEEKSAPITPTSAATHFSEGATATLLDGIKDQNYIPTLEWFQAQLKLNANPNAQYPSDKRIALVKDTNEHDWRFGTPEKRPSQPFPPENSIAVVLASQLTDVDIVVSLESYAVNMNATYYWTSNHAIRWERSSQGGLKRIGPFSSEKYNELRSLPFPDENNQIKKVTIDKDRDLYIKITGMLGCPPTYGDTLWHAIVRRPTVFWKFEIPQKMELIAVLVEYGAKSLPNAQNLTPIELAADLKDWKLVGEIAKLVPLPDDESYERTLILAIQQKGISLKEVIQPLLKAGTPLPDTVKLGDKTISLESLATTSGNNQAAQAITQERLDRKKQSKEKAMPIPLKTDSSIAIAKDDYLSKNGLSTMQSRRYENFEPEAVQRQSDYRGRAFSDEKIPAHLFYVIYQALNDNPLQSHALYAERIRDLPWRYDSNNLPLWQLKQFFRWCMAPRSNGQSHFTWLIEQAKAEFPITIAPDSTQEKGNRELKPDPLLIILLMGKIGLPAMFSSGVDDIQKALIKYFEEFARIFTAKCADDHEPIMLAELYREKDFSHYMGGSGVKSPKLLHPQVIAFIEKMKSQLLARMQSEVVAEEKAGSSCASLASAPLRDPISAHPPEEGQQTPSAGPSAPPASAIPAVIAPNVSPPAENAPAAEVKNVPRPSAATLPEPTPPKLTLVQPLPALPIPSTTDSNTPFASKPTMPFPLIPPQGFPISSPPSPSSSQVIGSPNPMIGDDSSILRALGYLIHDFKLSSDDAKILLCSIQGVVSDFITRVNSARQPSNYSSQEQKGEYSPRTMPPLLLPSFISELSVPLQQQGNQSDFESYFTTTTNGKISKDEVNKILQKYGSLKAAKLNKEREDRLQAVINEWLMKEELSAEGHTVAMPSSHTTKNNAIQFFRSSPVPAPASSSDPGTGNTSTPQPFN